MLKLNDVEKEKISKGIEEVIRIKEEHGRLYDEYCGEEHERYYDDFLVIMLGLHYMKEHYEKLTENLKKVLKDESKDIH